MRHDPAIPTAILELMIVIKACFYRLPSRFLPEQEIDITDA